MIYSFLIIFSGLILIILMGDLFQTFFFWLAKLQVIDSVIKLEDRQWNKPGAVQKLIYDVENFKKESLVISKQNLSTLLKVIKTKEMEKIRALQSELKQKKQENDTFRVGLQNVKRSCQACPFKDATIIQLRESSQSFQTVQNALRENFDGFTSKIQAEFKDMKAMKGKQNKIEKKSGQLKELEEIKSELRTIPNIIVEKITAKYEEVLSNYGEMSSQIKSQIESFANQSQSEVKSLKESIQKSFIGNSKKQKENKNEDLSKIQKLLVDLNENLQGENKNYKDEILRLTTKVSKLEGEIKNLQTTVEKQETKIAVLQKEKAEVDRTIIDLTRQSEAKAELSSKQISILTGDLSKAKEQITQLLAQIDDLTQQIIKKQEEIEVNTSKITSTIQQRDEKTDKLYCLTNDLQSLKKQLQQEKTRAQVKEKELNTIIETQESKARKSEEAFKRSKTDFIELQNSFDQVTQLLDDANAKIKSSENKFMRDMAQAKHTEKTLLKTKQSQHIQIDSLIEEKRVLTQQNETLTEEKRVLTEQNETLTEEKRVLTQQNEILTEEKRVLTEKITTLTEDIRVITEQNETLTFEERELREQVENLRALPPPVVIERNYDIYFQNEVLVGYPNYKQQMIAHLEKQYERTVYCTKLVYRLDPLNTLTNFHKYFDNIPNIAVIVRLKDNRFIAAFSNGCFKKESNYYGHQAFIYSLHNNTVFGIREGRRAITYDDFYLIMGNSQFRLRHGERKIFSNFGIAQSYFDPNGQRVNHLFGEGANNEVPVEYYEIYQVVFDDEELSTHIPSAIRSTSSISQVASSIY